MATNFQVDQVNSSYCTDLRTVSYNLRRILFVVFIEIFNPLLNHEDIDTFKYFDKP
jgi:hypothetical protein